MRLNSTRWQWTAADQVPLLLCSDRADTRTWVRIGLLMITLSKIREFGIPRVWPGKHKCRLAFSVRGARSVTDWCVQSEVCWGGGHA